MKTFLKSLALVLALTTGALAAPINQGPIYIYQPLGGSSGGGGTGCVPAGAAGNILTDTGAGACGSDNSATLSTGALTLGASGTLGSLTLGNATSGTITLQPVTGVLGTVTLSLPAATDTIAVLAASQTFTNKAISGSSNTLSNIGNSSLTNSSTTVNGQTCTLGSTCTVTASASGVTVGTTTITTGTPNGLLYDNAGVLGNLVTANSGVLVTSGAGAPSISTTLPNGLALGTPGSVTLTNATGLPVGGITGLGTGIGTWLATPSSANLAAAVTDETGSGALVFGTSPTITLTNATGLPISTGLTGAGTGCLTWLGTPSSANLRGCITDETGTGVSVFNNSPTLTTPAISGVTDGSNANSGYIGEYISTTVTSATAVSITTATPVDVATISLTAGDWDVQANVAYKPAAGTSTTQFSAWVNSTSATFPSSTDNSGTAQVNETAVSGNGLIILSTGDRRINITGTTTIYMGCEAVFTASTAACFGTIRARRVR